MSSRQEKLAACVARISREEGVPPFCAHANEVITRTLDLDRGTASAMARIVLKDLGLTAQILRAANSAFYNHSGRPILSVPHGISLLGWDALHNLVSTVRYIEHYAHRSPGLRELMLLSTLSAIHGREIAVAVGYPNPEEAHVCGLFRNLGEVLVGCHCAQDYAKIILTMHQEHIPQRAACLRVLDFTSDELGSRVAAGWNMPPKVHLVLRGFAGPLASDADRCLASIANYARDLTHALYRDGAGVEALDLPAVQDIHGRRVLVSPSTLSRITDVALEEARTTLSLLGIPVQELRLEQQAEKAGRILAAMPVFDSVGLTALEAVADDVARTVRQGDFELTALIATLLEAVRAAGFDRSVFALLNEERTSIRGRLASGGQVDDVLQRFQFTMDQADGPLRAALHRRNDVLVDRSRDGRYDHSSLVTALGPSAFALFPIVADRGAIGCLYADRQNASPGLEGGRAALGHVRDAMAAAIRKKSPQAVNGR